MLPALGACNNTAPQSGETATCDNRLPIPANAPAIAVPGSVDVTPGSALVLVDSHGLFVRDASTATNRGTLRLNVEN